MFNIQEMLKQAQDLQSKIRSVQESLADKTVTGTSGGDMVRVEVNGALEVVGIKIDKTVFESGDQEMVEDLVAAAVNDALAKARQLMMDEMSKLTGGMNIAGMLSPFQG